MDLTTEKNWWQRNWKWVVPVVGGIILLGVICTALPFITLFGIFENFKSSALYQTALKEVNSNPDVVQALGEPIEAGWWVNGSINISGPSGQANLAIPISGPKDSGTLYLIGLKTAGQWRFMTLEVAVDGQDERINLLKDSVIALPDTATPPILLPTYTSTPTPSSSSSSGDGDYQQTPEPTPPAPAMTAFNSATLGFSLDYPETWQKKEETLQVVFSPSADGLDPHNLKDASIWIGKTVDNDSTIADMLADALAGFPPEAETLREGTIRIASQTWTSVQIRFDDEALVGGQGIATLIVTNIDGKGYFLVAVAPEERWNSFQPFFQAMINSFRFSSEVIGQATSTPAPSPTSISLSGRIVFSSSPYDGGSAPFGREKNFEIYVMNADGSNQTRLTYNQVRSGGPDWSPDGSRIVFSSGRDQNFEIYVMNADGSNQTRLTYNQGINQSPDWSPDGSRIAFESNHDIYVMDADGSNQTRLTDSQAFDKDSDWSPDGSRIVFSSNRDGDNFEIYVIEADGSNLTRLTYNTANDHEPVWSPDGSRIAFYSFLDTPSVEIYVMDADGSNLTRLTNNHAWDSDPQWSPDGKYITFTSARDGTFDIYVMNADGSEQTSLTHNPGRTDFQPSWSP